MTDPAGTIYVVIVLDAGRWRRLMTTQDRAQAEALRDAILADGVEVKLEKYPPGKSEA